MEIVRRREEVGAVVQLAAVIEGQQIGHGLVSLCVFRAFMYLSNRKSSPSEGWLVI